MPFAFEKLRGLDRDRVLSVIEPILRAHDVAGVELIWRTDNRGWVLYLTVERPNTQDVGAGITLDTCTDLSRDLSTALDVAEAIPGAYRLEVGSPGVERQLYGLNDYERFAGQVAKLKCRELVQGQKTLRGSLSGLDEQRRIVIETDQGLVALAIDQIESGQLVLELGRGQHPKPRPGRGRNRRASGKADAAGTGGPVPVSTGSDAAKGTVPPKEVLREELKRA